MATTADYMRYVCDQACGTGEVTQRKMFGEYMIYVDEKPVLLVCDNTVFVKIVPELESLMADAARGFPYEGAKEHYVLDIDDAERTRQVIDVLRRVLPFPRKKKKKGDAADAQVL